MKLYSPISPTRPSSTFLTNIPSILLLSSILLHPINALTYPTTIEIDLLFPLPNKAYHNMTSFPVIFALQNVPAANEYGYTISWDLRSESSTDNSTVALGTIYKMTYRNNSDSEFLFDDGQIAILPDTVYQGTRLKRGTYALNWKYSMVTCLMIGDRTQYNIGRTQASNTHSFRIEEKSGDEMKEEDVDLGLDVSCPVFGDSIVVRDATKGGCPIMAGSKVKDEEEEKKDPCRAKLNAKQASCIQGNVAGRYNDSMCREAFGSGGNGKGRENGADGMVVMRSGMFALGVVGLAGAFLLL
ncbi:uncharacterized protein LDX57_005080 [Aspergillus melleus]|uniref:uncharacterized protein n=1 Tax=Aspergillus melleus TaxID=138277 RepID=UPI001E8E90D7|nr:uncharacterized protein LDX57_005080 [Aspergillus melleus]KAH8427367.1 hypothetical protein LDX57_005080 [Aspergillus melleus]